MPPTPRATGIRTPSSLRRPPDKGHTESSTRRATRQLRRCTAWPRRFRLEFLPGSGFRMWSLEFVLLSKPELTFHLGRRTIRASGPVRQALQGGTDARTQDWGGGIALGVARATRG